MADLREAMVQLDQEEAVRAIVGGMLKDVWTSLPVTVSEDSDGHTVSLQPSVKGMIRQPDGSTKQVSLPVLQDVPVHFPGGGGATFTHPVKKGDEGIVVFMCRNHDQVQQNGGEQQAGDLRNHSMSDARYIPGGRSDPRKLSSVSTASSQLRSDDGKHYVDLHPTNGITHRVMIGSTEHKITLGADGVKVKSPTTFHVEAPISFQGATGVSSGPFSFETLTGQTGTFSGVVSAASYATTSDARLKDRVRAAVGAKARLAALRIVEWDWKAGGGFGRGVLAQEAGEQYPHAVHRNEEGVLSFDYGSLIPDIVQALQSVISSLSGIEKRLLHLERKR